MRDDVTDKVVMVIPSIEGGDLLARMLPTLRCNPANVVVLDQASTDATAAICRAAGVQLRQLGRPHSYTEACNIGAQIAREGGFPFLCIANNDITFGTDVLAELLAEMERDPSLGIVAPSQVIRDAANGVDILSRRVSWDLDRVAFLHDFEPEIAPGHRLEADFCELTCALIRMSAVAEIGFLDDVFGFYHEDADFGFRLRQAGYNCAYLLRSQIDHFTSSTFSKKKQTQADYLLRNRIYFARKHLGHGLDDAGLLGAAAGLAAAFERRLPAILRRFGLVAEAAPLLTVGRLGADARGYLFATHLPRLAPDRWGPLHDRYRTVIATSEDQVRSLRDGGFSSFQAPLGIDPDVFHPGDTTGLASDPAVFLAIAEPLRRCAAEEILRAWQPFASGQPGARLILLDEGAGVRLGRSADRTYRSGPFEIEEFEAEQVQLRRVRRPLTDAELAGLYRSAGCTVIAGGDRASLTMLESVACGTPCAFDPQDSELVAWHRRLLGPIGAEACRDDAAAAGLPAALARVAARSPAERRVLAAAGVAGVLRSCTLRHTTMAIRAALAATQARDPEPVIQRVQSFQPADDIGILAQSPIPLRVRLSGTAARQLTRAGRLTERFGTAWQERGLPAALAASAGAVRRFAAFRAQPILQRLRRPEQAPPPPVPAVPVLRQGTLLIGYIDAQVGIGQSLRGLASAMDAATVPFRIYPVSVGVEARRTIHFMPDRYDTATPHAVNIIEVSPAELRNVREEVGAPHLAGSYNILRTYWELARGPAAWRAEVAGIHEIWAPNAFCANAFRDFFDGPITIVPPCIEIGAPPEDGRLRFGLEPGACHFLFSFDYHSFWERKNPMGVVRAFMAAFPGPDSNVRLFVKASGTSGRAPPMKRALLAAAAADGRITILDESLSRDAMLSLMASVDCYVSLHRSEGFGLGMAEALALGKPVIATGYSGNAEFVTERTGYPIGFALRSIPAGEYVHAEGQVWADPDEAACAAAMRAVVDRPAEAAARADAGRRFVEAHFGPAPVGRIAAERIQAILNRPR